MSSNTSRAGAGTPFRLMDLPTELRLQIFRETLNSSAPATQERSINLLAVSKQVNQEARDVLYADTVLKIELSHPSQSNTIKGTVKVCPKIDGIVQDGRFEEQLEYSPEHDVMQIPKALTSCFRNVCIELPASLQAASANPDPHAILRRLTWDAYVLASVAASLDCTRSIEIRHPNWTLEALSNAVEPSTDPGSNLCPSFQQLLDDMEVRLFDRALPRPRLVTWLLKKKDVIRIVHRLETTPCGRTLALLVKRNIEATERSIQILTEGGYRRRAIFTIPDALQMVERILSSAQVQTALSQVRENESPTLL